MKKAILLIVILLYMITTLYSCSSLKERSEAVEELKIFYIDTKGYLNPELVIEEYSKWVNQFNQEFDRNVEITPILNTPLSEFNIISEFEKILNENGNEGIVIMPIKAFQMLSKDREKYFIPFGNEIYANSNLYEWPIDLINFGKHPQDETIWCLPAQYSSRLNLRVYNKNTFEQLGINPPKTIEDLVYALGCYKTTFNKYPIYIDTNSENPFSPFSDLFSLFGVDVINTISYDYYKGEYKNILDFEGVNDVLQLLRDLYYDGIISTDNVVSPNSNLQATYEGDVFTSIIMSPFTMTVDKLIFSNLDLLPGSIVDTESDTVGHVAVLLKGTKNAEKYTEDFIDMFLSKGEEYIAATIGFIDVHYNIEDGIPVRIPNSIKSKILFTVFSDLTYEIYNKSTNSQKHIEYKEAYLSDQHKIEPFNIYNFIKREFEINTSELNNINDIFSEIFVKIFDLNFELDDLISEYKKMCGEFEVEYLINEINSKINSK